MLSRNEWKAVRRRMTKKPRLFSKKFIASQFSKRNQYRNSVRMLQRNVDAASKVRFPYDVPAPIAVGTTVNAYSKNYRIVQRGTVMTFDYETALYLILFENRQFGYELCPDSDVATCGPPKILVHCARETTRGNWFDDEIGQVAYDEGTVFETSCKKVKRHISKGSSFNFLLLASFHDQIQIALRTSMLSRRLQKFLAPTALKMLLEDHLRKKLQRMKRSRCFLPLLNVHLVGKRTSYQ